MSYDRLDRRCTAPRNVEEQPGLARTRTPERFRSLIDDVEERLFGVLPDDGWVYRRRGKDTTIGTERLRRGEWRARGW